MWTLQPYKEGRRRGFTVSHRHNGEVKTSTVIVCKTDWLARISHPHRPLRLLDLPLLHPLDFVFSFPLAEGLQKEAKREALFSLAEQHLNCGFKPHQPQLAGEQAQTRLAPLRSRDPPCPVSHGTLKSLHYHESNYFLCSPSIPHFNSRLKTGFFVEHPQKRSICRIQSLLTKLTQDYLKSRQPLYPVNIHSYSLLQPEESGLKSRSSGLPSSLQLREEERVSKSISSRTLLIRASVTEALLLHQLPVRAT